MELSSRPWWQTRRFWITVACFAVANLAVWLIYHHTVSPARNLLQIESFLPGENAILSGRETLTWRFNLDLAPDLAQGAVPAEITPSVAGRWQQGDARTLIFVPEQDLPAATRFTVTFAPDRLRTPEGFRLRSAVQTQFRTMPLRVQSVRQAGRLDGDRFVIELRFTDRVLPADLADVLTIRTPDDVLIPFAPHGEAPGNTVRVLTERVPWPAVETGTREGERSVRIALAAGFAGLSGPLGLESSYATTLTLEKRLIFTQATASYPTRSSPGIQLTANGPVDLEAAREVLSVEPAVEFTLAGEWPGVHLRGNFAPNTRYTITVAAAPEGTDPTSYPRPDRFSVFVPQREPGLWFEHPQGYLGLAGTRILRAHAVNLQQVNVQVWRVYDSNIVQWCNVGQSTWGSSAYARPVITRTIDLSGAPNEVHPVDLRLEELLPAGTPGHGVFRITLRASFAAGEEEGPRRRRTAPATTLVTLSDIGLTAKQERNGVLAWVTSLHTGEPMPNVRVRLYSNKSQLIGEGRSDGEGLARLAHSALPEGEAPAVLLAEQAPDQLTWLALGRSAWRTADLDLAGRPYLRDGLEAFVYTDRGVYRPGETVHLSAIVRDADLSAPGTFPITWQIRRPDLRDYRNSTVLLEADGSAGLALHLPEDITTGRWTALIGLPGDDESAARFFGSVTFHVEEYLPNRMKTSLRFEPAGARHQADAGPLTAVVQADYLFGLPAAQLRAELTARLDAARFAPQQWRGWTFGDSASVGARPATLGALPGPAATTTDDAGQATFLLPLALLREMAGARARSASPGAPGEGGVRVEQIPVERPPGGDMDPRRLPYLGPWRLHAVSEVHEVGGRVVSAGESIAIDLLPWYIGVRTDASGPIPAGSTASANVQLVDSHGQAAEESPSLRVFLYRVTWNNSLVYRDGRYQYISSRRFEPVEDVVPSIIQVRDGSARMAFAPPAAGQYALCFHDPHTGAMTSQPLRVVHGNGWEDNVNRENPERIELTVLPRLPRPQDWPWFRHALLDEPAESDADPRHRVGETAHLLVHSPFAGRMLLTVETDRVVETRVIDMPASQMIVPVPITEACRPNAYVSASVVRPVQADLPWRTHRAFGIVRLEVSPIAHDLDVQVAAEEEMRPRRSLDVTVIVRDAAGRPVPQATVTLAAVDEGILQLTGFVTPDPLAFFTAPRALAVRSADLFSQLIPETPRADAAAAVGGDGELAGGDARHRSPVSARRVDSVALFAGAVRTDADGRAVASFHVPQFTGRLRLMAVAHQDSRFGSTARDVTVRLPLMVQSSFPRFAAPGDRFIVPLLIFNNGDDAGEVALSAELLAPDDSRWTNPLRLDGDDERVLALPAVHVAGRSQATAKFGLEVRDFAGVGRVRIVARMGGEMYEETIELPVRPASPRITRGGYLVADSGQEESFTIPGDLLAGTESLTVRIGPRPALALPAGLEYLERYPYGCAEQTISACFPLVYLADIGPHIAPGVFERQRVAEKVEHGVLRLMGLQAADGGLAMWPGGRQSWPWASVYAAHFLVEAEAAGHEVPADFRDRLLGYVRQLLDRAHDDGDLLETQAYAAYVLALAGQPPRSMLSRLTELSAPRAAGAGRSQLPPRSQARMFLSLAWLLSGRRDMAESLIPTVPPPPRQQRQLDGNVGSPVRDRALLINTLLIVQPDHPALPDLVQHLADQGAGGRWRSTQDNAFAVMALGRYLRHIDTVPFDRVELRRGDERLASADELIEWTGEAGELSVRVAGPPDSRAHVAWIQSGVPVTPPPNTDSQLAVRRRYLDRHHRALARLDVASGDLVLVELTVEGSADYRNLVIEDLLPAGLEIENPRLATSFTAAAAPEHTDARPAPLRIMRVEMLDDRLVLMADMPGHDRAVFTYTARAVTAGEFIVPPVRGEAMYDSSIQSLHRDDERFVIRPVAAVGALAEVE